MNLLDALTFKAPAVEKKVHRNKHKPGTKCARCDRPRHIFKSGRISTYCKTCDAARQRDVYNRMKEERLKQEMSEEHSCSFD